MVPPHEVRFFKFSVFPFSSFEVVFQTQLAALVFILFSYAAGLGYD